MKFEKLLEPGMIGKLEIGNRVVKAPLQMRFASRDGAVTPRLLQYYKEVAKGKVGLVLVEHSYIDNKASQAYTSQLGIYDDECISGLATLADTIKQYDSKAGIQINHAGIQRTQGTPIVGPSQIPRPEAYKETGIMPTELTIEEIDEIAGSFGKAVKRAKQAGFDIVEIHCANGYLLTNFLSNATNRRKDWYGGTLGNRMRFPLQILKAAKEGTGSDFPIGMRIAAEEYEVDGITLEESEEFAERLETAGADFIDVTAGNNHTTEWFCEPMYQPVGSKIPLADAIKKVVRIPVIASGSITTPELAEEVLRKGSADFVSLGRPLIADPYFVKKIQEGRIEDITPCIRCMECLLSAHSKRGVECTVNVSIGRSEEFLEIGRAPTSKEVAVVGGGPAGMEAAMVALLRGHNVFLYEKQGVLGGLMNIASIPEFKSDLRRLVGYYRTQLEKMHLNIIKEKATADTLIKSKYDQIVVATGSIPIVPNVASVNKSHVATALEILQGKEVAEEVVVIGGGTIGCETALFLAEKGKKVNMIEMLEQFAADMDRGSRNVIMKRLRTYDVGMHAGLLLREINDDGITVSDKYGMQKSLKGDSVVLALGMAPDEQLVNDLTHKGIMFKAIGDCKRPRRIRDAIYEGYLAARAI